MEALNMKRKYSIYIALLALMMCLMTACDKEVEQWPQMRTFYGESCGLQAVPLDSVSRFKVKVDDFTMANPASKEHPLYPKIRTNIQAASLRLTITINDEWDGETFMNY